MRGLAAMLVLAVGSAAACGDPDPESSAPDRPDAAVYAMIINWFADREPLPEGGDDRRTVFLDGLDDDPVPLDVQVAVVRELEDELAVRFIDATDEAVSGRAQGSLVRGHGLFLRLGPVVAREGHVEVDVERFETEQDVSRFRFDAVAAGAQWRVAGEPVEVPVPEPAA